MELENKNKYLYWQDEKHPNYERWKRSREIVKERGFLVKKILQQYIEAKDKLILDIGCGIGGTSLVFSTDNNVVSLDINYLKLLEQPEKENLSFICSDAMKMPFKAGYFDIVILQDVIEHLPLSKQLFTEIYKVLKKDGLLYISTPNKYSIFNIISDPHWGIPIVALCKRKFLKKYFVPVFRKKEILRDDIAELLSLSDISYYMQGLFDKTMQTSFVLRELFSGNQGIVWSDFHLRLIRWINRLNIITLVLKLSNDKEGVLNSFLTPTYYFVCRKKDNI